MSRAALHWAAHWDDVAVAEMLLRAGARVGARNEYGVTPLALAASNGSAAMVKLLLEHGADPNADGAGYTALHWAAGSWETTLRFDDDTKANAWYRLGGLKGEAKLALIRALLAGFEESLPIRDGSQTRLTERRVEPALPADRRARLVDDALPRCLRAGQPSPRR